MSKLDKHLKLFELLVELETDDEEQLAQLVNSKTWSEIINPYDDPYQTAQKILQLYYKKKCVYEYAAKSLERAVKAYQKRLFPSITISLKNLRKNLLDDL